jgi:TLR4 regulator and MIR-interacting MSAP
MQFVYLSFYVPVCKAVVDEVEGAIDRVSPNKKVEVGSFRLDGSGNLKQTLVRSRNNSF